MKLPYHLIIYAILFLVAFLLSIRVNYKKKRWYKEELKLYWGIYCYHLHHFITYSLFIGLILLGRYANSFITNCIIILLLGILIEDFMYGNVFKLREKC
jgi:hypothetical protein